MENEQAKWMVENNYGRAFIDDWTHVPRQAFYDRGKVKVINLSNGIQHILENEPCGSGETMNVYIKSTKTVSKSTISKYKKLMRLEGDSGTL